MTLAELDLTVRTMAPPGASQDLFLRALQPILLQRFGRRMIIDNLAGEDGLRAARAAKADPPDGRHLLVTSASTMTFYPGTGEAGFAAGDFDPLLGIGRYSFVLITAGPWPDFGAVIDDVRSQGRALRHAGTGEPDRLLVSAMAARDGVAVEFLPRNGPALLEAVTGGQADIGLGTGTHQPLLEDGRVRVVAQLHSRAKRGPGEAPTPQDFGIDAYLDNLILVSAPAGLEPARRALLIDQLTQAVDTPEVEALLTRRLLMAPGLLAGDELSAALAAQSQGFAALRAAAPRR